MTSGSLQLHAPDHAGQVAHEAAMFADAVTYGLLAASSPTLDPGARRKALERLFSAWPSLCRVMAELEAAAPRSAAVGAENAARLRDVAERQKNRSPSRDLSRSPRGVR